MDNQDMKYPEERVYRGRANESCEIERNVYKQNPTQQLKRSIETKFNTAIIGIIARFEEYFGDLWGHDKNPNEELNESEREFLKDWRVVRRRILDHGHRQVRAAKQEIDLYFVRPKHNNLDKKEMTNNE